MILAALSMHLHNNILPLAAYYKISLYLCHNYYLKNYMNIQIAKTVMIVNVDLYTAS